MFLRQLCKISSRFGNPTSFRCLKDMSRCLGCLHKASLRCLFADCVITCIPNKTATFCNKMPDGFYNKRSSYFVINYYSETNMKLQAQNRFPCV